MKVVELPPRHFASVSAFFSSLRILREARARRSREELSTAMRQRNFPTVSHFLTTHGRTNYFGGYTYYSKILRNKLKKSCNLAEVTEPGKILTYRSSIAFLPHPVTLTNGVGVEDGKFRQAVAGRQWQPGRASLPHIACLRNL